jgi:predicted  nucleic acid-binding Zn-ribbon protein
MAGLPIFLIKGTKSLEAESNEITGTISSVREQLRAIQEKYARNQKSHISNKDKQLLKRLRKEETFLQKKQLTIENQLEKS